MHAGLILGGHTHLQMLRRLPDSLFANPVSVDLPFSRALGRSLLVSPWAEYVLASSDEDGQRVEFRRVHYDVEVHARGRRAVTVPARRVVDEPLGLRAAVSRPPSARSISGCTAKNEPTTTASAATTALRAAPRAAASRRTARAAARRRAHVHRADDGEVVVEADERRDDADDHEPGPAGSYAAEKT